MKYSVSLISGKQYIIHEGDRLSVDKLKQKLDKINTLLLVDNEKILIGKPYLKDVVVKIEQSSDVKGDKIHILKYKAKSRYRKHIGFRPLYTPIKITSIAG